VIGVLGVSFVVGCIVFYAAKLYAMLLNKIGVIKSELLKQVFSTIAYVAMCFFIVAPMFIVSSQNGATLNWDESVSMFFVTYLGYLISVIPGATYYYLTMVKGKK